MGIAHPRHYSLSLFKSITLYSRHFALPDHPSQESVPPNIPSLTSVWSKLYYLLVRGIYDILLPLATNVKLLQLVIRKDRKGLSLK